jgi:hypothetical protein
MKTRLLVTVVLSLVLLVSTAPPSTAHSSSRPLSPSPPSMGELTVPTAGGGSSAISDSVPASPSSTPCLFSGWVTVFYENFDSVTPPNLPPGWLSSWISGSGTTQGVWQTYPGTVQPSGAPAASPPNLVYFNSYYAYAGQTARLHRTTALDLRHFKSLYLCLRWYRDADPLYSTNNDRVQPQISTNGGSTWMDVGTALTRYNTSAGWWTVGIPITSVAAGQPSVYIGFLGISDYGNDVHLDDIQVTAVPAVYLPLMSR